MSPEPYTVTSESAAELTADMSEVSSATGVRCALVVDRAGRIIASSGETLGTDVVTFASLAAADFNANEQLAKLVGERGFRALVHRGANSSVYVEDTAGSAVLVVLFGSGAAPGLVRELAREAATRITSTLERMAERQRLAPRSQGKLFAGADEEIDRLFDW